jgi:hypothetical protein
MKDGMSLAEGTWPKFGTGRKDTEVEAWEAWTGIMNAFEIAFGCCSLDPAKPFKARIETTHFAAEIESMEELMALYYDMEVLWEHWEKNP